VDRDGDGHDSATCGGDDCDDLAASRYPGAPELCNFVDDDCDGDASDETGCGQRVHLLEVGVPAWRVDYVARAYRGAGAPPGTGLRTAWPLCDFGLACVGTADRWYCFDGIGWRGNTWASVMGAAPSFAAPSLATGTASSSAFGRSLLTHDGPRFWSFSYSAAPASAADAATWPLTLSSWHGAAGETDRDTATRGVMDAPQDWARLRADWIDWNADGSATWNLLDDVGAHYRLSVDATGTPGAWLPPTADPRFELPGAPPREQVAAATEFCGGELVMIADED
jgi:hypothetical protein